MQSLHLSPRLRNLGIGLFNQPTGYSEISFPLFDFRLSAAFGLVDTIELTAALVELAFERVEFVSGMVGIQYLQIGKQRLIASRFASLPLQRSDLPLYFFNNVADSQQVCIGGLDLAQSFALLRLVLHDAGRFFEHRATIFRFRAQDQIDLALFHHRIGAAGHAGVSEQRLNIFQPAQCLVQEIL